MSIQAYQRAATQADSPRELEYRAFGKATAALVRWREQGGDTTTLIEICEFNRKLWNIMSADCSLPGNALPMALRASIISLAIWVSKHTREVLRDRRQYVDHGRPRQALSRRQGPVRETPGQIHLSAKIAEQELPVRREGTREINAISRFFWLFGPDC
jgi:flagellar protein FlaF